MVDYLEKWFKSNQTSTMAMMWQKTNKPPPIPSKKIVEARKEFIA